MSDWLFDLGNSRLKAAPIRGRTHGDVVAIAHGGDADAFAQLPADGDVAYLSSVATPTLTTALLDVLAQRFRRICIARTQAAFGGMRIAYAEPARLGVDRFLALLGAHARGGPALVVAIGTALTIDLLDVDGRHRGGRIAPSPTLMREALYGRASQLPPAGGEYREFADDTLDALASGCQGAALGLIERSLQQAGRELGQAPALVLHGGGAAALVTHLPHARLAPALVLEGLARWAAVECERG